MGPIEKAAEQSEAAIRRAESSLDAALEDDYEHHPMCQRNQRGLTMWTKCSCYELKEADRIEYQEQLHEDYMERLRGIK